MVVAEHEETEQEAALREKLAERTTRTYKARGLLLPHLQAWRIKRTMNVSELAELAGVNRGTVNNGEAGKVVGFPSVRKLAAGLGISVEELLHAPAEQGK